MNKEKIRIENISSQEVPPGNIYFWLEEALIFWILAF